jgi:1-acyl-sn-glycerol-3-phosphate acyltransferase
MGDETPAAMFKEIRRIIPLLTLVFSTICLSIVALALYPFDRKGEKINRLARCWAVIYLKACGIRVSVNGLEHISKPPYIFMCNHQSVLDIFALLSSLRLSFKWIAKKELFSVPFLGWALKAGSHIGIDRKNPRKALKAMNEAAHRIREGTSIIVFPEGTWSKDGTLLPFKKGGFSLAHRTGTPIIPVGIRGTGDLQPEGYFVPREKGLIVVKIGRPVYMTDEGRPAKTRLMIEVRSHIERLTGYRSN